MLRSVLGYVLRMEENGLRDVAKQLRQCFFDGADQPVVQRKALNVAYYLADPKNKGPVVLKKHLSAALLSSAKAVASSSSAGGGAGAADDTQRLCEGAQRLVSLFCVVWEWRDDKGAWHPYDASTCARLEAVYKTRGQVDISRIHFVDTQQMLQRQKRDHSRRRRVQRRDLDMEGEEKQAPPPEPCAMLGSRIWGQKMGPEGSRLAESERGVWFSWKRVRYLYTPFQ